MKHVEIDACVTAAQNRNKIFNSLYLETWFSSNCRKNKQVLTSFSMTGIYSLQCFNAAPGIGLPLAALAAHQTSIAMWFGLQSEFRTESSSGNLPPAKVGFPMVLYVCPLACRDIMTSMDHPCLLWPERYLKSSPSFRVCTCVCMCEYILYVRVCVFYNFWFVFTCLCCSNTIITTKS